MKTNKSSNSKREISIVSHTWLLPQECVKEQSPGQDVSLLAMKVCSILHCEQCGHRALLPAGTEHRCELPPPCSSGWRCSACRCLDWDHWTLPLSETSHKLLSHIKQSPASVLPSSTLGTRQGEVAKVLLWDLGSNMQPFPTMVSPPPSALCSVVLGHLSCSHSPTVDCSGHAFIAVSKLPKILLHPVQVFVSPWTEKHAS